MKRHIPLILDTLAVLALAIWLGGVALCWLVLAPTVNSVISANAAQSQQLFADILRRFSAIIETCGIVLVALQWVLRRRYQRDRQKFVADGLRMVATFMALFAAEYGRYGLIPALIRSPGSGVVSTLEGFAIFQAVMLVVYAGITVHLLSPRALVLPAVAPTSAPQDTQKTAKPLPPHRGRR